MKRELHRICIFHIYIDIFVKCNWVDTRWFSEENLIFFVELFHFRYYKNVRVFTARYELTP